MSDRIAKVNSLLQEELSQIILKEVDFPKDVLVTITRIDTAPNLSNVKVYVSTIPDKEIDKVLDILNKIIYHIQQKLNKRLNMRPIPKIGFKKEVKTVEAAKVEEILEEIKKNS